MDISAYSSQWVNAYIILILSFCYLTLTIKNYHHELWKILMFLFTFSVIKHFLELSHIQLGILSIDVYFHFHFFYSWHSGSFHSSPVQSPAKVALWTKLPKHNWLTRTRVTLLGQLRQNSKHVWLFGCNSPILRAYSYFPATDFYLHHRSLPWPQDFFSSFLMA